MFAGSAATYPSLLGGGSTFECGLMLKNRKLQVVAKAAAVLRIEGENGAVRMEDGQECNPSKGSPAAMRVLDQHALVRMIRRTHLKRLPGCLLHRHGNDAKSQKGINRNRSAAVNPALDSCDEGWRGGESLQIIHSVKELRALQCLAKRFGVGGCFVPLHADSNRQARLSRASLLFFCVFSGIFL